MLIATKFEAKLGDTVTSYLNPKQLQAGQEFKVIFSCRASSRPAQAQEKKTNNKGSTSPARCGWVAMAKACGHGGTGLTKNYLLIKSHPRSQSRRGAEVEGTEEHLVWEA